MPWFKVDDDLAFHHKVVAAGNTAMGLWVRAGAWSAQTLTDGFVPKHMVAALGSTSQARKLVSVGLWTTEKDGYRFHQWPDRQPTRVEVDEKRAAARERMRQNRAANKPGSSDDVRANGSRTNAERSDERKPVSAENFRPPTNSQSGRDLSVTKVGISPENQNGQVDEPQTADVRANFARSDTNPVPSRPVPYMGGHLGGERQVSDARAQHDDPPPKFHPGHEGSYDPDCDRCTQTAAAREAWLIDRVVSEPPEPPRSCERHPDGTGAACRACQTARQAHDQWQADRTARRRATADQKRDRIASCPLCDEAGWRIPPPQLADADPPVVRCTHEPAMPGAWRELIAELLAEAESESTEHEETKTDV